jgi:hypothetical protein
MTTTQEKLDARQRWLTKHEFGLIKHEDGTYTAFDLLDPDGFSVNCPTKEEAINEAYENIASPL